MKQTFIHRRFQPASLAKIVTANRIVEQYMAQGFRLTLRQLYYQFVAHHGLPNTEQSYKNLASIISKARLAGLLDWEAIEDRGRQPDIPPEWNGIKAIVESALCAYRRPRWKGQDYYAELWVEKQALAGVLEPLANKHHVTLMVNKGYSSQSAMYESAKRFLRESRQADFKRPILFYLGDHDPSGEDMVRDIHDRMEMFGVGGLDVRKLAITMEQIEEYGPPPNPAKVTDPRAEAYIARHGNESWEVDALDPTTLQTIVTDAFDEIIDREKMEAVVRQEEEDKVALRNAAAELEETEEES